MQAVIELIDVELLLIKEMGKYATLATGSVKVHCLLCPIPVLEVLMELDQELMMDLAIVVNPQPGVKAVLRTDRDRHGGNSMIDRLSTEHLPPRKLITSGDQR